MPEEIGNVMLIVEVKKGQLDHTISLQYSTSDGTATGNELHVAMFMVSSYNVYLLIGSCYKDVTNNNAIKFNQCILHVHVNVSFMFASS